MEKEEIYFLRDVEPRDIDLLFCWANEKSVRQNSFHTERIPFEEHTKWFNNMINDPSEVQYIFMCEKTPIGQIRFSISDDHTYAEIDYSIDISKRGKGLGKKMISYALESFGKEYPQIKKIIGKVKEGNIASEKSFIDCGFSLNYKQFEINYGE